MRGGHGTLETLFGVGFRLGFVVAFVGAMMIYAPFIYETASMALDYLDFWGFFNTLPLGLKLAIVGLSLVAVAVLMGAATELVRSMVDTLFPSEE